MAANIHPGLKDEYGKLRRSLVIMAAFAIASAIDLLFVLVWNEALVIQWRPALLPVLLAILFAAAVFLFTAKRRMDFLLRSSEIVRRSKSREMILKTWRKDFFDGRNLFFFDLDTEDSFGCANASYVVIAEPGTSLALPYWCEQSWQTKAEIRGVLKAFIDEKTGLLVAVQTSDALAWMSLNIHFCRSDDKERLLDKMKKETQLSGESAK